MKGLLPIIRRARRPLIDPDYRVVPAPVAGAPAVSGEAAQTEAPLVADGSPKIHALVAKQNRTVHPKKSDAGRADGN